MQTHNRHLDTTRAVVAATPHPTTLHQLDLITAIKLADMAREQLQHAYKALKPDDALRIQAETAGLAVKRLVEAARARLPGRAH